MENNRAKTLALYLGCEISTTYGVYGEFSRRGILTGVYTKDVLTNNIDRVQILDGQQVNWVNMEDVKLLLRPLSSMSESEAAEHQILSRFNQREDWSFIRSQAKAINYLRSVGIDCDGLIDRGEAIDVTNGK